MRTINRDYNINRKRFTLRKLFHPISFKLYNNGFNVDYANDIKNIHQTKINNKIKHMK